MLKKSNLSRRDLPPHLSGTRFIIAHIFRHNRIAFSDLTADHFQRRFRALRRLLKSQRNYLRSCIVQTYHGNGYRVEGIDEKYAWRHLARVHGRTNFNPDFKVIV